MRTIHSKIFHSLTNNVINKANVEICHDPKCSFQGTTSCVCSTSCRSHLLHYLIKMQAKRQPKTQCKFILPFLRLQVSLYQ